MGCAAAYHLARRGRPVRAGRAIPAPGHDRGGSHGAARIIRHSYADERYARIMPAAFRAWRDLEAESGQVLYVRTGGVSLSPPGVDYVEQVAASLGAIGCPHRRMSGEQLHAIHPVFHVPDDYDVVFEPDAGPEWRPTGHSRCRSRARPRSLGGRNATILDNAPVLRLDLDADRPTLVLADAHDHGRSPDRRRRPLDGATAARTGPEAAPRASAGALLLARRYAPVFHRPPARVHLQGGRRSRSLLRHARFPRLRRQGRPPRRGFRRPRHRRPRDRICLSRGDPPIPGGAPARWPTPRLLEPRSASTPSPTTRISSSISTPAGRTFCSPAHAAATASNSHV